MVMNIVNCIKTIESIYGKIKIKKGLGKYAKVNKTKKME